MIDNVVLLITGTLHERDTHELLERCHPLGVFDTLPALCVAMSVEELYQSVLVKTPLGAPKLHSYLSPPPSTTFQPRCEPSRKELLCSVWNFEYLVDVAESIDFVIR